MENCDVTLVFDAKSGIYAPGPDHRAFRLYIKTSFSSLEKDPKLMKAFESSTRDAFALAFQVCEWRSAGLLESS